MTKTELKDYLARNTNFGALRRVLKSKNPALLDEIDASWSFSSPPHSFLEVVYQYFNPTDIVCRYGNKKTFEYYRTGYRCKKGCKCTVEKQHSTMVAKYGVQSALQSPVIASKFKATITERYGYDNLHKAFAQQRTLTNNARYGTATPLESKAIQQQARATCAANIGVAYPFQSAQVQSKASAAVLDKYGVPNVLMLSANKEKAQHAVEHKYGVTNSFLLQEVQDKVRNTMNERYGVDYYSQAHIDPLMLAEFKDDVIFAAVYSKYSHVSEMMDYFGVSRSSIHHRAKELGLPVKWNSVSAEEQELADFLIGNEIVVEQSNRTVIGPKEIDIWLPEHNVGIEYNGIYHHSSKFGVTRDTHNLKTITAEKQNVRLIQIFSDEWKFKQDIVKSRILNIIGKTPTRSYARNTVVEIIDTKVANRFLNENHVQGSCQSSVKLGLMHNNELVAIMTFGKPRFSKQYSWELIRFCNRVGTTVVGGASKLLSYFRRHHSGSIVSYADRRWSDGGLYQSLGFTFSHNAGPNYFYVVGQKRESRNKWQKHKLPALLENFKAADSEVKNMEAHGYYRVFDCGNSVWYIEEKP